MKVWYFFSHKFIQRKNTIRYFSSPYAYYTVENVDFFSFVAIYFGEFPLQHWKKKSYALLEEFHPMTNSSFSHRQCHTIPGNGWQG